MEKILIIDDSEVIRSLLKEYLLESGYSVELAVDGQDGIEKVLANDYAAIFCDIHMPRKNGYQVFREAISAKPDVHFIMTDSLPDELAEMALNEGAQQCLTKPFDLNQVKDILAKISSKV
jgi:two-component system, OmpR family, alkaline phosphatase synthesis response regulator PhoP